MEPIEEGYYYHIYNRGAGRAPIFFSENDYHEFMAKYVYYLFFSVETYAWCLLKNHFHLLVKIRTMKGQEVIFNKAKKTNAVGTYFGDQYDNPKPFTASKQFAHLFNSYTKYINQKRNRSGTLIEGTFKRKKILDENHFLHLACYIHRNPLHHRIVQSYEDYPYSSFHDFIDEKKSFIDTKHILSCFGGRDNFVEAHREFQMKLGEEFYLE